MGLRSAFFLCFLCCSQFLRAGHRAYVGIYFSNKLQETVTLVPSLEARQYVPQDLREFQTTQIESQRSVYIAQEFLDYESLKGNIPTEEIMRFVAYVGGARFGTIKLLRSSAPDPFFLVESEQVSDISFRRKKVRCGRCNTIEIVYRN